MQPTIVKPVADPLDDIDRVSPVDSLMARQDRADLPGNRSDEPGNGGSDPAQAPTAAAPLEPDDVAVGDDVATRSLDDPDVALAMENAGVDQPGFGPDDDEPIEETERLGDDSRTV